MYSRKKHLSILLALGCVMATAGVSTLAQQAVVLSRPVLTSLHPSAATAESGASSTLVVVAGLNFAPGNTTVLIQGAPRATTVINSEALVFELTSADLAQPRTLMVTAANRSGTASFKSNALPFVVLP